MKQRIIATMLLLAMVAVSVLFLCCPSVQAKEASCHGMGGAMLMDGSVVHHSGCAGNGSVLDKFLSLLPEVALSVAIMGMAIVLTLAWKFWTESILQERIYLYLYFKIYERWFVPIKKMLLNFWLSLLTRSEALLA